MCKRIKVIFIQLLIIDGIPEGTKDWVVGYAYNGYDGDIQAIVILCSGKIIKTDLDRIIAIFPQKRKLECKS